MSLDEATELAVNWFNQASELQQPLEKTNLQNEAIQLLTRIVDQSPEYSTGSFFLGMMLQQCGDSLGAMKAFQKCLKFDPTNVDALNNLGKALSDQDKGVLLCSLHLLYDEVSTHTYLLCFFFLFVPNQRMKP
jgi:tetratricopeptide (TPR) repeat protein